MPWLSRVTIVSPYLQGMCSKTHSGGLKPWMVLNPNVCFSYTYIPFHLKEVLYGFSLACLNCQHHCSCTLGPLLSKIRVIRTQALWYLDSRSGNPDSYQVTNGGKCIQRGRAGQRGESCPGRDGVGRHGMQSRYWRTCNFTHKLFLEFSIQYFRTSVQVTIKKVWKLKLWIRGNSCTPLSSKSESVG